MFTNAIIIVYFEIMFEHVYILIGDRKIHIFTYENLSSYLKTYIFSVFRISTYYLIGINTKYMHTLQ